MILYLQMIESQEDKTNFEKIYHAYRGLMYYTAFQILNHQQDAEDAVHSAFVKIAEHIEKISDPVCPQTRSLIVIITRNNAIDLLRSRKRHRAEELNEKSFFAVSEVETTYDLTRCFLLLPDRYRDVLLLKYHYGYSIREIAKLMDLSYNAAAKLEQRAKKRLEDVCVREGML